MRPHLVILAGLLKIMLIAGLFAQGNALTTDSITVTASSTFLAPFTIPELTMDGSGLTGDLHDNHPLGHTMWLSSEGGGGNAANNPAGIQGAAWLRYEFDKTYELDRMLVWNHNQENLTNRGLKNVSTRVSKDGIQWDLVTTTVLSQAPGTPGYAPGDEIDLGGAVARQFLITAAESSGNYGSSYYGLSEVQFYGTPVGGGHGDFPFTISSAEQIEPLNEMLRPRESGWLGSDVAHSIPLSAERSLWLFGDTFIGELKNGARAAGAKFINNSIGIQDRTVNPPDGMEFYWGAGDTSFFPHQNGTPGTLYWPTMGIMLDGELFIFCYAIDPGLFVVGTVLIRIGNPLDPPTEWNWTAADFGIGSNDLSFHSAVYVEEPYVYFLGTERGNVFQSHIVLARMTSEELLSGGLADDLEFWVYSESGPSWKPDPENLVPLFSPGNTETHVHYEPLWDRFFVTTYDVSGPTIYLATARELTGPWSEAVSIYEVPEHESVSFEIISYAARPHPELSSVMGELVISYATNSPGDLAPLFTQEGLQIYAPRFFRVQLHQNISQFWMIQ